MEKRCLVLDFDSGSGVVRCFNRENHKFIHVKIGNGESSNENHLTFDRQFGYADWYGFVDCSEVPTDPSCSAFKTDITVNDSECKDNKIFKVVNIKVKIDPRYYREEYDLLMKKMEEEEEKLLEKTRQLNPERPSRSVDAQRAQNKIPSMHNKKSRSRSRSLKIRAVEHDSGPPINISEGLSFMNISGPVPPMQSLFETSSSANTFSHSPVPPPLSSLPPAPQFVVHGLVIQKEADNCFIVWLFATKQIAYLPISTQRYVIVGTCYEFRVISKNDGSACEITNVGKRLEMKPSFEIHQMMDKIVVGIHVDLCCPNTRCQLWSFYMGIPFFNSPDVGIVTMADYLDTPIGLHVQWQETLRLYLGDPRAKNMQCICQLVKQKLPQKLHNSFISDDFVSSSRYIWQIVEVCSSEQHHQIREAQLKRENLGSNGGEFEQEDEIARQKRNNRPSVRFEL
ncbi:hypothetical protein GCK72_003950 [Caenorhabditis remanei]|uniref:RSD-2 N-terminal domain-containing protein n=1 Tax=Caenorhabditis remanei TaxID=31234 RepID=A0A6A5HAZ4_CAERE|nr:hypothetical protein GCK72_003950 [Caenorhabditis remanei]KAF1764004.1 hypothetical protein GCK72_003950 [Caenorhabditis remanei]